ncbi:MAG TPA: universal stress protein [Flavisolibacter sp.]|jgi:nucleotide-binding universal stress UspA family protein|nr:universal stress protein [Flavisolibacter sp.]
MSVLLIPTDFSPASDSALDYGLQLAGKLGASVLLAHVYEVPVSMNDLPVLLSSAQDLKDASDRNLERTVLSFRDKYASVPLSTVSRMGDTVDELLELAKEHDALALVVPNPPSSGLDKFLLGSPVNALLRKATVPVLVVSESPASFRIEKIALALHEAPSVHQLTDLTAFLRNFQAAIELVHVKQKEDDTVSLEGVLTELQPHVQVVEDEDLSHGLQNYIKVNQIDLLGVLTHRHSWLERTFSKTHESELVDAITIPLLCFPEERPA